MVPVAITAGVILTLIALMIAIDKLRTRRRHRRWESGKYGQGAAYGGAAYGGTMYGGCGGGPSCGGGGGCGGGCGGGS